MKLIVFGSSTGVCEEIAGKIARKTGAECINVAELTAEKLAEHDMLFLGTSTWGAGELQDDWYEGIKVLKDTGLTGKTVAIFGCGDSESYPDTFCGGMRELYDAASEAGANIIGAVDSGNYSYDDSEAVVDGKFVGLALDDVNEPDKTDGRIDGWLSQLSL
ncbi:MAG: flavodoxin FldA [Prevotella sp.]|nr:flavodoxin FldA [Prevotella sp.]